MKFSYYQFAATVRMRYIWSARHVTHTHTHKKNEKIEKVADERMVEEERGGEREEEMPSHIFACDKCDAHTHILTHGDRDKHAHAYILRKFHAQFQIWANGIPEQPIPTTQSPNRPASQVPATPSSHQPSPLPQKSTLLTCRNDNVYFDAQLKKRLRK